MKENRFIVFEGVCCSGKTTTSKVVLKKLQTQGVQCKYNHGAMSYTKTGKEYYDLVNSSLDIPISALYYYTDLLLDTKNTILPLLNQNNIVLQDRYYDSINTYTKAYGDFNNITLMQVRIDYLVNSNIITDKSISKRYKGICEISKRIYHNYLRYNTIPSPMLITDIYNDVNEILREEPILLNSVLSELKEHITKSSN